MQKTTIIEIDGIGPVLLERSKRARHLVISIKPDGIVRVAVPVRSSFRKAREFVELKQQWVQKHLALMRQRQRRVEKRRRQLPPVDTATAKTVLPERVRKLADTYGFTCNRVTIRNQKTRWGSCSSNNSISLNMKLLLLPDELIDYVLLHELAHTRVHNHSARFWRELDKYVGNGKALAKQLREYGYILRD